MFFTIETCRKHNRKTPKQNVNGVNGNSLFFSAIIPAKEESEVIVNTIKSLQKMEYPSNLYEIIIVTDQKETSSSTISTRKVIETWMENDCKILPEKKTSQENRYSTLNLAPVVIYDIPKGFDGKVNGTIAQDAVPSTKARALNYAFSKMKKRTNHYCSFFDAETHPDPKIFSYIDKYFSKEKKFLLWQGPALQVRNFWDISFFSKIAALSQAFSHEFTLPMLLNWIPFLGGTNMHIPFSILLKLKGFQSNCVTEDLELGVRIWDKTNEFPKFLPLVCTEQTPSTFKGYYYQRLRWGKGNIQVLLQSKKCFLHSAVQVRWLFFKLFFLGPFEWFFYAIISVFVTTTSINSWLNILNQLAPFYSIFLLTSIVLLLMHYLWYSKYMNKSKHIGIKLFLLSTYIVFIVPLTSFLYGLPFLVGTFQAIFERLFKSKKQNIRECWTKTPRTPEC